MNAARRPYGPAGWLIVVLGLGLAALADEVAPKPDDRRAAKEALGEFNALIGEWRGVGQPRRNSNAGAWSERAEWIWEFGEDGTIGLRYTTEDSKLIRSALLTYDLKRKRYRLAGIFADETRREYEGTLADKRLVLESMPDDGGEVHRVTITPLNEKRVLVLHEKRRDGSRIATRVAEIGYTRAGTSLAVETLGGPECIVTGGLGTMKVSHKGETYYVCCSGCRRAFEDDPEGTIAEYKERLKEEKGKE